MEEANQSPHQKDLLTDQKEVLSKLIDQARAEVVVMRSRVDNLQASLDSMAEAVVVAGPGGRITHANPVARRIYGESIADQSAEDLVKAYGIYLTDATTPLPPDEFPLLRALRGDSVDVTELYVRSEDSPQGVWVDMTARPLLDPEGNVVGAISVFRDITRRKQAEKLLQEHMERVEGLADLSKLLAESSLTLEEIFALAAERTADLIGDACFITRVTEDGQALRGAAYFRRYTDREDRQNPEFTQMEQPLPDSLLGGVVQTGQPLLIPQLTFAQAGGSLQLDPILSSAANAVTSLLAVPLRVQERVIGTLGVTREAEGRAYTMEDQTFLQDVGYRIELAISNSLLLQALQNELQERKRAEEALRASEERFRTIFQQARVGINLVSLDERFLESNPAFQEMLGYSAQELGQTRLPQLILASDLFRIEQLFNDFAAGELDYSQLEVGYLHKDGQTVWGMSSFSLVRGEEGRPEFVILMVEDISERRQMQAELAEVPYRLIESVEEERRKLAQEIHDGPMQDLYGVMFAVARFSENQVDSEEIEQFQETLQGVVQTLRSISVELRPTVLTMYGLEGAIRAHTESFLLRHPELEVHLDLTPDRQELPEEVRLALFRIYQIAIMNVIRHAEATRVDIRLRLDAENVVLEVQDDGRGFTVPKRLARLAVEGHLGLVGASERAMALGGRFEIQSRPGAGSLIRVVIPRRWEE